MGVADTGQPYTASCSLPSIRAALPCGTFPAALTVGTEVWESLSSARAVGRARGVRTEGAASQVASSQPLLCRILEPLPQTPRRGSLAALVHPPSLSLELGVLARGCPPLPTISFLGPVRYGELGDE